MSDIDFQNGFLCGMATKGMLRTGQQYEPKIWNDEGVYDYFYIDFKQGVQDFSTGMLKGSIILYDSVEIAITGFERISASVFKVFANIANRPSGVTMTNKKTTLLIFSSGRKVPPFSVHFYVAGQAPYIPLVYAYDVADFSDQFTPYDVSETLVEALYWDSSILASDIDTVTGYPFFADAFTCTEVAVSVSYWSV